MSTRDHPELSTQRVTAYVVGEVWPWFVDQYPGARALEVYSVVEKLADHFLFPQEASPEQRGWFLGIFDHMPDEVSWLQNEFRLVSDELMRLEISDDPKKKNQIGQLKFLVLLGVEEWSQICKLSKSGSIEKAAEVILGVPGGSVERKFESVIRQVAKSEEKHRKDFKELVDASVPRTRNVAETHPEVAREFPDAVAKLDQKLQESRDAQVKGFVADGVSEMAKSMSGFIDEISQVLKTTSSEVKGE